MSNAIGYSVERILREIPAEVLHQAFGASRWEFQYNRSSLEACIRSEIIEKIVMVDCNIVGGEVITIPLVNAGWTYLEHGVRIDIPLSLSYGRRISSVLSLEMVNRGMEPYQISEGVPGATGTPEIFLVGPNTVFVPVNPYNQNSHLRCTIENDANLGNFNQKALLDFGDLAVAATKGYVYNKLAINISITANTGGMVDGRLREVIDSYSDAFEIYREILRVRWKKINMLQDRNQHLRLIQLGLPK